MPWNFPVFLPVKAIPQLLAGNPILLKPAPCVLTTTLVYDQIFNESGWRDFH